MPSKFAPICSVDTFTIELHQIINEKWVDERISEPVSGMTGAVVGREERSGVDANMGCLVSKVYQPWTGGVVPRFEVADLAL